MNDLILSGKVPAFYELSWRSPDLIVRIHKNAMLRLADVNRLLDVGILAKEFSLPDFWPTIGGSWGYGGALKVRSAGPNFWEYVVPIPRAKKDSGEYDWKEAFSVLGTLSILGELFLQIPDPPVRNDKYQLLRFEVGMMAREVPITLFGEFSRELVDHLGFYTGQNFPLVVQAMRDAWTCIEGEMKEEWYGDWFKARIQGISGRILIDCPNSGLYADHHAQPGQGYQFSHHERDSAPGNVLVLIAGLAALHDLARDAGV